MEDITKGIIGLVSIVLLGALGVRALIKGKEIYKGPIDLGNEKKVKVVYTEAKWPAGVHGRDGPFGNRNQMTVTDGKTQYTLIDDDGERDILSPEFSDDKLERIIIKTEKGKEKFNVKDIKDKGLRGGHAIGVFEKGNILYHHVRKQIREIKQAEYKFTQANIPQ